MEQLICQLAVPTIVTMLISAFYDVAGLFGDAAVAGISVVFRITILPSSVMIGFGQGFHPVCGFNYGAKRYARARQGFWFRARFVGLLAAALLFVFAPQIVGVFRDDLAVI